MLVVVEKDFSSTIAGGSIIMCKVVQGDRVGSGAAEVNMAKQGAKDEDEGSTPLKSRLVTRMRL